jgi:hypothetical protein
MQHKRILVATIIAAFVVLGTAGLALSLAVENGVKQTRIEAQNAQIGALSQRLNNEPQTLDACLQQAALDYSNYIKANGTLNPNAESASNYSMSMDEWEVADSKLQAERANCQVLHGSTVK